MTVENFSWATTLSEENRLYIIDVGEDMLGQLELGVASPSIQLWNQVIKYQQLHPGDGTQIRQNYMMRRYQAAQLLERHGVVSNVDVPKGQSGYDVEMLFRGDPSRVRALIIAVRRSFPKRVSQQVAPVSFWKRYASEFFALVLGVAVTLAVVRWSWVYLAFAILPLVGVMRATRIIPSWPGIWKSMVDIAVVLGAAAAIMQLIVDVVRHGS